MSDRIKYLDSAKGLGIIIVILGHILLMGPGSKYIYSFHMPFFFFLSGYLFKKSGTGFIKNKSRSLLIPYLSFSLITYLYWVLIERHLTKFDVGPCSAFLNIFLSQGGDSYIPHDPVLWFLTCLFVVSIAFYFVEKTGSLMKITLTLGTCAIAGYILSIHMPGYLPWSIDVALTAIVFYGMGYIARNYINLQNLIQKVNHLITFLAVLCFFLVFGFLIAQKNDYVSMANNYYGNVFIFYIAAFSGIIAWILISFKLQESKLLQYWGRNSLIVLGFHIPIKRGVMGLTAILGNVKMEVIKESIWWSGLDTIVVLLILVPIIYIVNNYLYFLIGKHKSSKTPPKNMPI